MNEELHREAKPKTTTLEGRTVRASYKSPGNIFEYWQETLRIASHTGRSRRKLDPCDNVTVTVASQAQARASQTQLKLDYVSASTLSRLPARFGVKSIEPRGNQHMRISKRGMRGLAYSSLSCAFAAT